MAEFESCDKCKYSTKMSDEFPCNTCVHGVCLEDFFAPKTNDDKINEMSAEEKAEFLLNFKNTFGEEYEGEMSCLEWLKSEAKE